MNNEERNNCRKGCRDNDRDNCWDNDRDNCWDNDRDNDLDECRDCCRDDKREIRRGLHLIKSGNDDCCTGMKDIRECDVSRGVVLAREGCRQCEEGLCHLMVGLREMCFDGNREKRREIHKNMCKVHEGSEIILAGCDMVCNGQHCRGLEVIQKGFCEQDDGDQGLRKCFRDI